MTMSVHTFELKTQLSGEETKAVRDALYTYAKGKKDMCYPQNNRLYFNRWCDEGVRFFLESSASVPGSTLHLVVTPAKVLGSNDAAALVVPSTERVNKIYIAIEDILSWLPIERHSYQMQLSRLDLCRNIFVPEQRYVDAYIRLLKKGSSTTGWEVQSYPEGDERDAHSFRRIHRNYQVTVYDKLYQIEREGYHTDYDGTSRILRVEVSILRPGIKEELSWCTANIDDRWPYQILELADNGAFTMRRFLHRLVSDMPYYTLSAISEYLATTDISSAKQSHLLCFLHKINRYDLLDEKRIKKDFDNGKKRLKQLKELKINPVTIEARAGSPYLPSLDQLIAASIVEFKV